MKAQRRIQDFPDGGGLGNSWVWAKTLLFEKIHVSISSVNKAAHSGFETQRRRHQKSETGVSVAPKMCPAKF